MSTLPRIISLIKYFWFGYTDEEYNHYVLREAYLEKYLTNRNVYFEEEFPDDHWERISYVQRLENVMCRHSVMKITNDYFQNEISSEIFMTNSGSFREIIIDYYPIILDLVMKIITKRPLILKPKISNVNRIYPNFNMVFNDIVRTVDPVSTILNNSNVPNDTVPNDTVPNDTVPNDTVPNDTVPNDTVPNDTVPNDTVPNDTVPNNTVPNDTVPNDTVPNDTVPNDTVPNDTVPNDTVPNDTVPNDTVPNDTVPNDTVPNDTVPNDTVPNDTVPNLPIVTVPNESVPNFPIVTVPNESVPKVPKVPIPIVTVNIVTVPNESVPNESVPNKDEYVYLYQVRDGNKIWKYSSSEPIGKEDTYKPYRWCYLVDDVWTDSCNDSCLRRRCPVDKSVQDVAIEELKETAEAYLKTMEEDLESHLKKL